MLKVKSPQPRCVVALWGRTSRQIRFRDRSGYPAGSPREGTPGTRPRTDGESRHLAGARDEAPWRCAEPFARVFARVPQLAPDCEMDSMTATADSTRTVARKISILLAGSWCTLGAFLGLAGCMATATPQRVPPPPSVTVVESKRMTVPIIVNPIGTTRALEEVIIRARVRGFLTERHFEDGIERQEGPAPARD